MQEEKSKVLENLFKNNNSLMVKQATNLLEVVTGFEFINKYTTKMEKGEELKIAEISDTFQRWVLGPSRTLIFGVFFNGKKILSLERPFAFFCPELKVYDETNEERKYIGKVETQFTIFTREYLLYDQNDKLLSKISGNITAPWTFNIHKNEKQVGKVHKEFSGLIKEMFTDSDNFTVNFDDDLSLNEKILIFSSTFLIDLMYFEDSKSVSAKTK
eukprot:gene10225-2645_t